MRVSNHSPAQANFVVLFVVMDVAALPALAGDMRNLMETSLKGVEAELNLSAEQKGKVDAILQNSINNRMAVFKEYNVKLGKRPSFMTLITIRSKMGQITADVHRQMVQILNDQQMENFDDISEVMRQKMRSALLGR